MPHQIAFPIRSTILAALAVAMLLAFAGSAAAKPDQVLTERAGDQPAQSLPQVGDRPADRAPASAAATTTQSTATSADDDNDSWPYIAGASLLTVALLGSGTFVVLRRRHVVPGH